ASHGNEVGRWQRRAGRAAGGPLPALLQMIPPLPVSRSGDMRYSDLRGGVRQLCERFPSEYWREVDRQRRYPEKFVQAVTDAGYLGALIPVQYGGLGMGV